MNSDNNYVLYWTLGNINVVLYEYSFFIADHLWAKVRPRPATEVIKVDLNYGDTPSPWGEPEQVGHNMHKR